MASASAQVAYALGNPCLLRDKNRIETPAVHLQGRDEILPLAELVREHVEPEAWTVVQALPDYYPKQAQPEQKALADA